MSNQARGLEALVESRHSGRESTRVVAVTSGKGGVGKSTLGANLGYTLSRLGYKTALLDADIGLANLDVMFNVKTSKTILHVLKGEATFSEITVPISQSLFLIPGESGDEILKFSDATIVSRIYQEADVLKGLDYLVVDTGAGIGETIQMFLRAADDVIVVTVPDPAAITDAYAMIKVASKIKQQLYMVVNQAHNQREAQKIFDTIKRVAIGNIPEVPELQLLGFVRNDTHVAKCVKQRLLVCEAFSNIAVANDIVNIARMLVQNREHKMLEDDRQGGIGNFFKRLLGQF